MSACRRADDGRLHVAVIGQKGLPATYGGIEHHVEELGARLVDRGVRVTVYCRSSYAPTIPATYKGMELVVTPTVGTKHLDAIAHSATSTAHALRSGADIIHYHAMGPGLVAPVPRYASRAKVALTVHGLDHERAKWGGLAKLALGTSHWMSGHVPDEIIAVSRTLAEHYGTTFGRPAHYIPNGVSEAQPGELSERLLAEYNLRPREYLLFVGRLVPEKCPDLFIKAFREVDTDARLVIVGDSSFTDTYSASLRDLAAGDPRVVFTGYVYQPELGQLYANAAAFVQPSALEGLPLTLLEAISYGIPVVASDIPPHVEVLGAGSAAYRLFPDGDRSALSARLTAVLADAPAARLASVAVHLDTLRPYSWDSAADQLAELYRRMSRGRLQ
ncbi:MAG TPA: glycosyltransferase family 4 protein [Dermatophilaceae bacterium]|jgi:glycosyltransferase involved in cell wall biosynthesis|nr:glycosyltransferase family 4 protein [Dermatophilaceae bacterium]